MPSSCRCQHAVVQLVRLVRRCGAPARAQERNFRHFSTTRTRSYDVDVPFMQLEPSQQEGCQGRWGSGWASGLGDGKGQVVVLVTGGAAGPGLAGAGWGAVSGPAGGVCGHGDLAGPAWPGWLGRAPVWVPGVRVLRRALASLRSPQPGSAGPRGPGSRQRAIELGARGRGGAAHGSRRARGSTTIRARPAAGRKAWCCPGGPGCPARVLVLSHAAAGVPAAPRRAGMVPAAIRASQGCRRVMTA